LSWLGHQSALDGAPAVEFLPAAWGKGHLASVDMRVSCCGYGLQGYVNRKVSVGSGPLNFQLDSPMRAIATLIGIAMHFILL